MTIQQLKDIIEEAERQGIEANHPVKLYDKASGSIAELTSFQVRKVQTYNVFGESQRNKYLLLSSSDLSAMSAS